MTRLTTTPPATLKTMPPYPCEDYWYRLTPREKINDLIHKIAQLYGTTYPDAYRSARYITDVRRRRGGQTLPDAIIEAGETDRAISRLIDYHERELAKREASVAS